MGDLLSNLADTIENIIETLGYPGIALVMFLENVFPPIPSELVMPFAGFLTADGGELNFFGVWIAGTIGSVLGAVVLYYLGWWASDTVVRRFLNRYGRLIAISEKDYDRALHYFDKYGEIIIFVGRLIPIIRSIISIPAGADKMPMPKFLLFTTLGASIWTGILAYAGRVLGDNWEDVIGVVEQYQKVTIVVFAIIGVGVVAFWGRNFLRSRQNSEQPASE